MIFLNPEIKTKINRYHFNMSSAEDMINCVICNAAIPDWGHNPDPISETGRCCDSCNHLVIVARIKEAYEK